MINFNKIYKNTALIITGVAMVLLTSCSSEVIEEEVIIDPEYPVYIGDTIIEKQPTKIATLSPSMTDMIVSLGFEGRLTGVADNSIQYTTDPTYNYQQCGDVFTLDMKGIRDSGAELIFVSAPLTADNMDELYTENINVVVIEYGETTQEILDNYSDIMKVMHGNITGAKMAEEVTTAYEQQLDDLTSINNVNTIGESGVYMRAPLLTLATGDTVEQSFFDVLGITNLGEEFTNWNYPQELAIALEPDMVLYADNIDPEIIKTADMYKTTASVVNSQLYPVDYNAIDNQSPRMFTELYRLSKKIYPEAYQVIIPEVIG